MDGWRSPENRIGGKLKEGETRPHIPSPGSSRGETVEELLHSLDTTLDGLTSGEASRRLEKYGPNEIAEKKQNPLLKFFGYFWGPIPWMIEAAAILSAAIQRWEDFSIISALLLLNAGVGFWQEHKAGTAIETLKQRLAPEARVKRDGDWTTLPGRELVPGDIVRVRLGDIIPADIRLLEGDYLSVDEAALTGESLPVEKRVSDIGYSGSVVRQGEMDGLVTATGMDTYFGRTARLVEEAETRSHFQKAVIKIGDYLIALAILLVLLIIIVALFRHESMKETVQFALVLTVAAIPAALPAVLSVTMAVGATALAKKEAIVSRLVAIEEMAGMDVLCSDKTGTITTSELSVAEIVPFEGYSERDVLLCGALASREEDRDPIDDTIIARARQEGLAESVRSYRVSEFKPFDPSIKRTESTLQGPNQEEIRVAKGAPQVTMQLVGEEDGLSSRVDEIVESHASRGYRSLGVARSSGADGWRYVGVIALYNPPRQDSPQTIDTARSMGVKVKMVTGDHAAVAREIARQVHLGTDIQSVDAFIDKPDREAKTVVEEADGFAEVFPEHKYHIVELLQEKGHIVGMTGDGVNDAPALKKADAGIAVAGATDAAKSAADIVLTLPGLSVIIDAIKESRKIFQRMNSYAIYRITETIRVLLFIVASILVFNFYPVTAVMIVLLALLNDIPIMAIAYDNVIYSQEPERWDMRSVLTMSTFLGVIGVFFSFFIYFIGKHYLGLEAGELQSFIFLKLAIAGHLTVFVTRTRGPFWSIRPSAALFWSALMTKILATLVVVYGWLLTPIGWRLAGFVWAYALIAFVITDFLKVRVYRLMDHRELILSR
ncbi:MAG: plasma-membrane proton-efflux P-type ATPase [Actinobacteria bacterium]|nr:plasma-membrane proton-efflux P-type ATPase [Actinomycetota bacterium]